MYCNNCYRFFDEDEVVHDFDPETGSMACCPYCGVDDVSETEKCLGCGEDFVPEDLLEGFCLECLWKAIDYDVALAYLKESELLADFMISYYFQAGELSRSSFELDCFLEQCFLRQAKLEKYMALNGSTLEPDLLNKCREFILPGYYTKNVFDVDSGCFAEWYKNRKEENS